MAGEVTNTIVSSSPRLTSEDITVLRALSEAAAPPHYLSTSMAQKTFIHESLAEAVRAALRELSVFEMDRGTSLLEQSSVSPAKRDAMRRGLLPVNPSETTELNLSHASRLPFGLFISQG